MSLTAVAVTAALGSGVLSFLAPCTLPLVPAYVGVLSGAAAGVPVEDQPSRLLRSSLTYVLGFTTVFVLLGTAAASVGSSIRESGGPVQRIGGGLVLVLGLLLLVESRVGWLSRIAPSGDGGRSRWIRSASPFAPLALGVISATAFTPCVGPFLGATLALAATAGGALSGAVLLGVYSLGLGVPFVVVTLLIGGSPSLGQRLNRWSRRLSLIGAVVLVILGLALLTGSYSTVTGWLVRISPSDSLVG